MSQEFDWVTCGSTLKIAHMETAGRLHSHEVKYGTWLTPCLGNYVAW